MRDTINNIDIASSKMNSQAFQVIEISKKIQVSSKLEFESMEDIRCYILFSRRSYKACWRVFC
jgi:hypothetical protein